MTVIDAVPKVRISQFTGGNAAEILALAQEITGQDPYFTASLNAGSNSATCIIDYKDSTGSVSATQSVDNGVYWVNTGKSFGQLVQTDLDWNFRTYTNAMSLMGQTSAFAAAVAAGGGSFGVAAGIVCPGLATTNFDITITPAKANTSYVATPFLTGTASLLGSLSIASSALNSDGTLKNAQKLSASQVRVPIANSGALQLTGAAVLVHVL